MTETQKRIKAYRAALPGLKERVAAVALLLVMSVVMMTSATFAWLTISRAPELSGVTTNLAANGNLEIALASGDGETPPGDSKVGDSSATDGQSISAANLTWGNMINLSDPSYGLDNLALRPAQLNTVSLLDSPLYGAMYGQDGRITQLSSDFGYATWNMPTGEKPGYFGVSETYGVRAISSTKVEAVGAEAQYYNMVKDARDKNLAAANAYASLSSDNKKMQSLATMMGLYMTARMNPDEASLNNPSCAVADIQNLRDMYAAFLEAFDAEADAMAALANLTLFLMYGENNYTPYTAETIYATTTAKLNSEGIQITDLDQFIKDRNTIASDLEKLNEIASSGASLKWKDSGLNGIVNNLVNVGACTIGANNTPISSIGASNAMSYLSGTQEAKITNGILYRFEERTGGYIVVKNLSISATVKRMGITVPATVKANVQTTAPRDYNLFTNDLTYAESLNDGNYAGGVPVAEDTYGLAVDLWVRTNAEGSYLTLEGNLLTESEMVRAMGKDANGNEVELYTVTISATDENGESVSYSIDVYEAMGPVFDEDGTPVIDENTGKQKEEMMWFSAETYSPLTAEELNNQKPTPKMVEKITVTGYEGENRVWGENEDLSVDATTQGSGSCYVYYADTPEDQARSLKLLEAFNVAFVNKEGELIAEAVMDTEHFYAESGRVIVPLVLSPSSSINLGEDYQGNVTYAITALEKNVATRITAIVYLDGTKLTNKEVLAAADIQGKLNIQFGSSNVLSPIENEELANKERRVSASVDVANFDYDTATGPMTTNVTVKVDGDEPSTVTAFFLRAINASQGSREEVRTFTKNESGDWTASYEFTVPGNYVLRTVQLDGVEYDLAEPPEVKVSGFAIRSLSCTEAKDNHIAVMTAENTTTANLKLKFATDDESKLPKSVQGRFLRNEDGSAVNINFTYDSTTGEWKGSANFLMSGDYTMQYVVLDGEYVGLDEAFWMTADITLGMRVAVYTTSPQSFKYVPSEMEDNMKLLGMQVMIVDNAGNEMPGLSGVKLTYGMKGSGIKKMDTDLTWNGSYYVGTMSNGGPGIWQFGKVVVGSNTLTNATTAPTFTILSPEPPEYVRHETVAYQYKPNNDATMNVVISNSSAAAVQAYIIKDGATEGTWVDGTISQETTANGKTANYWNFAVPKDANGYQDGHWTLTTLRLWNVFAADGTAYTEEAPLEIDVSDTNNATKAVNRIFVSFAAGQSKDFGKDGSGNVTATFMQSHTISGLNVDFKDFENAPVSGVSEVKLQFAYVNGTSEAYGGYTSNKLLNTTEGATINITLSPDAAGTHFTQSADAAIQFAGNYYTTFSYTVNGTTYEYSNDVDKKSAQSLPTNAPVFTVWSKVPSVTIDAIAPEGRHTTLNLDTESEETVESRKVNNHTIEIYSDSQKSGSRNFVLNTYPQITLSVDKGAATKATLTFVEANGEEVKLYTSERNGQTDSFIWESSTTCKRFVGYFQQRGTCSSAKMEGAGTLQASKLILEYNGVTYEVVIPEFTIVNIR